MDAWHRSRETDWALRAIGLLLCAGAFLAISHLIALRPSMPERAGDAETFLLAAVGFSAASAGSAMTCLGRHLFDRVEISARWGTGTSNVALTAMADLSPHRDRPSRDVEARVVRPMQVA